MIFVQTVSTLGVVFILRLFLQISKHSTFRSGLAIDDFSASAEVAAANSLPPGDHPADLHFVMQTTDINRSTQLTKPGECSTAVQTSPLTTPPVNTSSAVSESQFGPFAPTSVDSECRRIPSESSTVFSTTAIPTAVRSQIVTARPVATEIATVVPGTTATETSDTRQSDVGLWAHEKSQVLKEADALLSKYARVPSTGVRTSIQGLFH